MLCCARTGNVSPRLIALFILIASCCGTAAAQLTPQQKAENLDTFEKVWSKVRDRHPDPKLNGLDWQKIHDQTKPLIETAQSMDEVRRTLRDMLAKLESSHYAIIPVDRYAEPAKRRQDAAMTPGPTRGGGRVKVSAGFRPRACS